VLTAVQEVKVTPTELIILDPVGNLFLSQEIFGLGSAEEGKEARRNQAPASQSITSPPPIESAAECLHETNGKDLLRLSAVDEKRHSNSSLSSVGSDDTSSYGSAHPGAVRDIDRAGEKLYERLGGGGDKRNHDTASTTAAALLAVNGHSSSSKGVNRKVRFESSIGPIASGDEEEGDGELQEGEKKEETSAAAAAAPDAVEETSLTCGGGVFIKEECVVCLTEHKEVMLLPCRY
jgi:hypothetical protein